MSKPTLYCQCLLTKPYHEMFLSRTSWIPVKFAVLGKVLKLRERGGEWDDGWKVSLVGSPREDPPDFRETFVSCPELRRAT